MIERYKVGETIQHGDRNWRVMQVDPEFNHRGRLIIAQNVRKDGSLGRYGLIFYQHDKLLTARIWRR